MRLMARPCCAKSTSERLPPKVREKRRAMSAGLRAFRSQIQAFCCAVAMKRSMGRSSVERGDGDTEISSKNVQILRTARGARDHSGLHRF